MVVRRTRECHWSTGRRRQIFDVLVLLELLLVAAVAVVALAPLRRLRQMGSAASRAHPALAAAILCWAALSAMRSADPDPSEPGVRVDEKPSGYLSSNACKSCHAREYASWHHSYHRSMTQLPSAQTITAPWSGVLEWRGVAHRLLTRGGEFWVELPDPDRAPAGALAQSRAASPGTTGSAAELVSRRVVMTTGSHHYQAYWVRGARGNELWQFPFVYHYETRRFIPRHDAFLQPETDPPHTARWNSNCVQCHSVAGQPAHDVATDRFETSAAELGIACEACHGPGERHVARQRDPLSRHQARTDSAPDPSIINPARLEPERASEVCGQCHAYFVPRDAEEWWEAGFSRTYRPGDALDETRVLLDPALREASPPISADLESVFYADGTIRVGGREWNGLRASACFARGQINARITCLSCHQMHGGTREDQLRADAGPDSACTACHREIARRSSAHSHHPEGSAGNECVNCHMPFTTYALFKTIRSHRITSPRAESSLSGAPPNACNLCHQDRSLEWTSRWLETWYGPARGRREPGVPVAEAALGLLAGDAAVRVVFADRMGWAAAQEASGLHFQAQLLIEALDDPYAAVRFVAHRSLRTLPRFESFEYDFIAPRPERLAQQARARDLARAGVGTPGAPSPELPLDALGRIDPSFIAGLIAARDDRPIRISE